jgi:hypothetical protein
MSEWRSFETGEHPFAITEMPHATDDEDQAEEHSERDIGCGIETLERLHDFSFFVIVNV